MIAVTPKPLFWARKPLKRGQILVHINWFITLLWPQVQQHQGTGKQTGKQNFVFVCTATQFKKKKKKSQIEPYNSKVTIFLHDMTPGKALKLHHQLLQAFSARSQPSLLCLRSVTKVPLDKIQNWWVDRVPLNCDGQEHLYIKDSLQTDATKVSPVH